MCRCFCIGFIDFIFKRKTWTEFTNLFSPNNFEKNDDMILNYFMNNVYDNIDPNVSASSNGRVMILSKCAICGSETSKFIKHQEAKGLLSKSGIKTPLSKVPILGDILF